MENIRVNKKSEYLMGTSVILVLIIILSRGLRTMAFLFLIDIHTRHFINVMSIFGGKIMKS
ncbi:MAG: hypothetical protein IIY49_03185 [Eubacterium sp.]|nr:hypothetical protein [Eubacterium sp.]